MNHVRNMEDKASSLNLLIALWLRVFVDRERSFEHRGQGLDD